MRKRWKLLAALAVLVAVGAVSVRAVSDRLRERRAIQAARQKAHEALSAAEAALDALSFDDGSGLLLPRHIEDLEESKAALAASLEREKKKLWRGEDLVASGKGTDALWAFEGAERSFRSVADSCRRLQVRANELRKRGTQAQQKIDLAMRERNSTRRALAEVAQADVGLPNKAKLKLDESAALLQAGEAKLESARSLMAAGAARGSIAAYDLAEEACQLFDQARGAAEKRRRLALEYSRLGLPEALERRRQLDATLKEAEDAVRRLRSAKSGDESAARASLARARARAKEAEFLIARSQQRFQAQDFEAASTLLEQAQGILEEAIVLAEQPKNLL